MPTAENLNKVMENNICFGFILFKHLNHDKLTHTYIYIYQEFIIYIQS